MTATVRRGVGDEYRRKPGARCALVQAAVST
jgi:hypothetical protein